MDPKREFCIKNEEFCIENDEFCRHRGRRPAGGRSIPDTSLLCAVSQGRHGCDLSLYALCLDHSSSRAQQMRWSHLKTKGIRPWAGSDLHSNRCIVFIQNDEFCIQNDEFCIYNDDFNGNP